ncbi:hypothetical protein GOQ04_24945, partial [Emticicia sp. ODNR4P]|nr:hypothetical protein [Emticicia sp. ODNR4P]
MKKDLLNYCSSTSLRRLGVGWFALICWLLAYTTIAQTTSPSVDLTTHSPLSIPSGATFEWHSSLPISAINKMDTASVQVATPGIYYGVYNYGGTTACYSTPSQLKVVTNSCGTSTINLLASVDSSTLAPGWHVSIHTSAIPSSSNMLTNTNVTVPNSSTTYFVAYRSSDGCFTSSNSVIVTVSTTCSVSILANLDNASVQSGAGALSINVLSNDTRDGQAVTLSTVSAPTISATPSHGSVQVNSDGTISYTPTSGYVG